MCPVTHKTLAIPDLHPLSAISLEVLRHHFLQARLFVQRKTQTRIAKSSVYWAPTKATSAESRRPELRTAPKTPHQHTPSKAMCPVTHKTPAIPDLHPLSAISLEVLRHHFLQARLFVQRKTQTRIAKSSVYWAPTKATSPESRRPELRTAPKTPHQHTPSTSHVPCHTQDSSHSRPPSSLRNFPRSS